MNSTGRLYEYQSSEIIGQLRGRSYLVNAWSWVILENMEKIILLMNDYRKTENFWIFEFFLHLKFLLNFVNCLDFWILQTPFESEWALSSFFLFFSFFERLEFFKALFCDFMNFQFFFLNFWNLLWNFEIFFFL